MARDAYGDLVSAADLRLHRGAPEGREQAQIHPLYAPLYVERWRPSRGWASSVRPALRRMLAATWRIESPLDDAATADWLELVVMLGDTRGAPLCLLLIEHLRTLLPPLVEHRGLEAHRDLCLMDLGLANPPSEHGVPLRELGTAELMRRDEPQIAAWLARQLEPFSGDAGQAAEFILRLSAVRTGLLAGPDPATLEQVLDANLWSAVE